MDDAQPPNAAEFVKNFMNSPLIPQPFVNAALAEKLAVIVDTLLADNAKFNLTAITDPDEIASKHILDSLICANAVREKLDSPGKTLLDVGSGAGFPSLPIAAALPELSVTALDSTSKKCVHMNSSAAEAGISNFVAVTARAEILARNSDYREHYDFVTARAVANLPVLSELCLPFVKPGGYFIAMKGASCRDEAAAASNAIRILGGEIEDFREYRVPGDENPRYLLLIRKNSATPAGYPRHYAQIAKKPL